MTACGGSGAPPRHPVGALSARVAAKIELVDLVVGDPRRAERVRGIYLRAWHLGHDFDVARARSLADARAIAARRTTPEAQAIPADRGAFESMLAPPIEVSRRAYEEYVSLMLEARALLTPDEFEKLDAVR